MFEGREPDLHRVLLVDDEEDLRFFLRKLLTRRGPFEIVGEAADGTRAIELAAELQPDITILDLMMPTSGESALPHLLSAAPSCMVVVCSALDPADHRDRLISAGAFACYSKGRSLELPELLQRDLVIFQHALAGEDAVVAWSGPSAAPDGTDR